MESDNFNKIIHNTDEKKNSYEELPELEQALKNIELHINEQPQSVQDMFEKRKNEFLNLVAIDGKKFIFGGCNGESILTLVQDNKNLNRYKTRIFRFSGSDHQWKVVPGLRSGRGFSFMKGEENNELHHYVQSTKLDKRIYKVINSLPYDYVNAPYIYLPVPATKDDPGKYPEELEFKEEYEELNNPRWKEFQKFCQDFYKAYNRFVVGADGFNDFTLQGGLYRWVVQNQSIQEFKNIKDYLEEINKNPEYSETLNLKNQTLKSLEINNNYKPALKKIVEVYNQNVSNYIEKCFGAPFPDDMIPDFSINKRIDTYFKPENGYGKEGITIEEYKVENTDGDTLVFAMAFDSKGRVYIDNIYDPRVGMNDYGVLEKITQMGHLVYKPEDYAKQASYGFPKKYSKEINEYVDISALWEKIPLIKKYKRGLIERGILK
ncbi:MAG TPA: hypothetical protein VG621_02255 [Candidatus Paceibacterota bacterium]|nr:hypothetical protein [Candidatus Paceibacterota bacterium]